MGVQPPQKRIKSLAFPPRGGSFGAVAASSALGRDLRRSPPMPARVQSHRRPGRYPRPQDTHTHTAERAMLSTLLFAGAHADNHSRFNHSRRNAAARRGPASSSSAVQRVTHIPPKLRPWRTASRPLLKPISGRKKICNSRRQRSHGTGCAVRRAQGAGVRSSMRAKARARSTPSRAGAPRRAIKSSSAQSSGAIRPNACTSTVRHRRVKTRHSLPTRSARVQRARTRRIVGEDWREKRQCAAIKADRGEA